jgi:RNA polymerase sigma factor (sigma-70 family)
VTSVGDQDDETAGGPGDGREAPEALRSEIQRGRRLDRDLAHDIGRSARPRGSGTGAVVEGLDRPPVLSPQDERALVLRARAGDAAAKAELVQAFMPLVSALARPYRSAAVTRLELLQEGVVGLLRALEGFDPDRGTPFWGYATWWVRQAMQQLVSELTRPVVLSDRALRHLARMRDAQQESLQRDGRAPTPSELADRTGLSGAQIDDLLAIDRPPRSLDDRPETDAATAATYGDLLEDPLAEGEYERVLARITVEELHTLLAGLSDRERAVVRDRYGFEGPERSLRDIGGRLGLSGERVRQIESRALGKLASAMGAVDDAG